MTGKIVKLSPKGWGFITSPEKPFTRIFFHWSGLSQKINFLDLKRDMVVSFDLITFQDKGIRAIKIELANILANVDVTDLFVNNDAIKLTNDL